MFAGFVLTMMISIMAINNMAIAESSDSEIIQNSVDELILQKVPDVSAGLIDNIPQSIKKYEIQSITDNNLVLHDKLEINKVSVVVDNTKYPILLESYQLRSPDVKAYITTVDGKKEVPLESVNTYQGTVLGQENSSAAFIASQGYISGTFRVDDTTFNVDPLNYYEKEASDLMYLVYRDQDVEMNLDLDSDAIRVTNEDILQSSKQATSMFLSTATADILLDCDEEFYDINTSNWQTRQLDELNRIKNVYDNEADILFAVKAHVCDTDNSELTSTDSGDLLGQFRDRWGSPLEGRDFAHLHSGKTLTGGTGAAWVDGVASPITLGYALSEHSSSRSSTEKKFTMAHEIGHLMGGDHPDHEDIPTPPDDDYPEKCLFFSGSTCITERYTILGSGGGRSPLIFSFSDDSLSGTHDNNIAEIIGNKSHL